MALDDYLRGEDERQVLQEKMKQAGRLPPGQSATIKWPVLHTGDVPKFDSASWEFKTGGLVEAPLELSWREFLSLPQAAVVTDFHCVTKWSTFDNRWEGVGIREILSRARPAPEARFVMAVGHVGERRYGYSTNIPLGDLDRDDVLLATHRNGEPIDAEHGGPLRLVVPHLYAWKSCKWIRGLDFMAEDKPGYWENAGYHMRGDPFQEERFG